MRLLWVVVVLLSLTVVSKCKQKYPHARLLISEDSQKKSSRHKLTAHSFGYGLIPVQEEESSSSIQQKSTDNKSKPKKDAQKSEEAKSQELSPQWHLYFVLMIIGTLVGMKILNVWQQRINQKQNPRSKSRKNPTHIQYFQNEFEEEINLASLP